MSKQYFIDGKTFTFDVVEETEVKVPMWYAKCRENGKMAWLDREGVQFEGENRIKASTEPTKLYITYEYDPISPDDAMPIIHFHDTLEEADAYAKTINHKFGGDIYITIYEAERRMPSGHI